MSRSPSLPRLLTVAGLLLLASLAHGTETVEFQVFLDDKTVGDHVFTLEPRGDELQVTSRAQFDVKLLGFTVYRYRHSAQERWRGDCLTHLQAETSANGDVTSVEGAYNSQGFAVLTRAEDAAERRRLGACVRSFAYWDLARLRRAERLLNPQTGEWWAVRVEALDGFSSPERLAAAREEVRYRLTTPNGEIYLGYDSQGRWLSLETQLDNGRTLRYQRRDRLGV
ncbi:MAG: DUF6134 family protein [Candidatus Competibacterales bacterium]